MKIASSALAMSSQHVLAIQQKESASLRVWIGPQGPDSGNGSGTAPTVPAPPVQISAAGKSAQSAEVGAIQQASDAVQNDPMIMLIKAMIEWMTGKPVKVFDAAQFQTSAGQAATPADPGAASAPAEPAQAPQSAGFGIEYDYHAVRQETEQTNFAAQGSVVTTDGQHIAFKLALSMARSDTQEINISARAGDAQRKDPLVVNFGASAAQLSSQTFRFDLQGNGNTADVALLGSGSGFLAIDSNHNGKIDSGKELFGPASGSGFSDLAKLDQDGNGWIDENDPMFGQLKVWTPAAQGGGTLSSLKDHNIGALYLGHAASAFELRGSNNQNLGAVRDSGVFLTEAGTPGSLQEVDLTV